MSKGTVSWSRRARQDLLEIGDFIARDKPGAAAKWVDRIIEAVERASRFPTSGRVVPEVGCADIREIIMDHYRIVYRTLVNEITVLTVFEGHRLPSTAAIKSASHDVE